MDLVILIKAVVFNGLDKWRDKGRNRVGSFNVFPEVPIKEFVISPSSPLAVIVVGAVINNFWEFRVVGGFWVRHGVRLVVRIIMKLVMKMI
jgi:hypothetical protein